MWQRMVGVRQCKWPELELDLLMDYGYRTQHECPDGSGGGQGKCKHGKNYCTQTKRIVLGDRDHHHRYFASYRLLGLLPHLLLYWLAEIGMRTGSRVHAWSLVRLDVATNGEARA